MERRQYGNGVKREARSVAGGAAMPLPLDCMARARIIGAFALFVST